MKHTPTPWYYKGITNKEFNFVVGGFENDSGYIYSEPDAAYIVRAVNSHDEFVDALHWALKLAEKFWALQTDEHEAQACKYSVDAARNALARAESKHPGPDCPCEQCQSKWVGVDEEGNT